MTDMNLADIAAVTNKDGWENSSFMWIFALVHDMYSKKATMIKYLHSML